MEWILVTLIMYRDALARAAALAVKNWPVLLSSFAYVGIMRIARQVALPFGLVGGLLLSIVWSACVGSFLYLVEMIVRTNKVTLDDFRRSFTVYLGDVLGVMFVFWIANMFLAPLLLQSEQGLALSIFLMIAIFVLFNAVPELIYLGHHSSIALLAESYQFMAGNWIEWLPAMMVSAVAYVLWQYPVSGAAEVIQIGVMSLVTYFVMVLRGLLFLELSTSSYRSRAFKYRARM